MENLTYEQDGKYYLKDESGDSTEISKWQFDAVGKLSEPVSGNLSEANILRLHQESDPASPLYKGPQPTDGGGPAGDTEIEVRTLPGYYEEPARSVPARVSPESTGTSVHTTEAATAANDGATSEEVIAEVEAKQAEPEADLPQASNPSTDESNA